MAAPGDPIRSRSRSAPPIRSAEAAADLAAADVLAKLHGAGGGHDDRMPAPQVQRRGAPGGMGTSGGTVDAATSRRIAERQGGGSGLGGGVLGRFESALGQSLGDVRVHTDGTADRLNRDLGAEAFTVGNDVFFAAGAYRPGSPDGDHLIAHELAHTLQSRPAVQRSVRGAECVDRPHTIRRRGKPKGRPDIVEIQSMVAVHRAALEGRIAKSLGKGGAGFTRSAEVRDFRASIKDAARARGRDDVTAAMDDDRGGRPLLETEKAWYEIAAKRKVYEAAKESVDTTLLRKATELVKEAFNQRTNAQIAVEAHEHGRTVTDDAAARTAISIYLDHVMAEVGAAAKAAKDKVVGKRLAPGDQATHDAAVDQTKLEAQQQVTADNIGGRSLDEVIEADSVDQGMGIFGKLLDRVLATAGDAISLSVEFRIPIPNSPAYVQIGLSGAAARGMDGAMTAGVPVMGDPRRLEVMAKLDFRAGADLIGLDAGGGVNVFARAGADTTALCTKALSYGAYRRLAAISNDAANFWALGPSSLDRKKATKGLKEGRTWQSEAWAAMIEEQVFDKGGGFSHVGGGIGGSITAKAPGALAEASAAASLSMFHKYDKDSLSDSMGGSFAAPVKSKQDALDRRKKAAGARGQSFAIGGSAKVKVPGVGGVAFAYSLSAPIPPASFGLEVTATLEYAAGSSATAFEKIAAGLVPAIKDQIQSMITMCRKEDPAQVGPLATSVAQYANAISGNAIQDGLADLGKVTASDSSFASAAEKASEKGVTDQIGSSSTITIALLGGYDDGHVTARIEIRTGRKIAVNAEFGTAGMKATLETSSRVAAVGYDKGRQLPDGSYEGRWNRELFGVRAKAGHADQRGKTAKGA